jgi:uncharacterized Fe-S cluster-containing radical SAM superfamily enzyme
MKREKGFMSLEMVEKIAKKICERQNHLALHFYGESMMHPKFIEIVKLLGNYKIGTSLFTNGYFLNDKMIDDLADCKTLKYIYITMNRFEPYENIIKLNNKVEHLDISLIVLNLPKQFKKHKIDMVKMIKWLKDNNLFGKIKLSGLAYDVPEKINGKYGCCLKNKKYQCYLRQRNSYCVLWDGRLVDCIKNYDGQKIVGTIADLDNLEYKTKLCPY